MLRSQFCSAVCLILLVVACGDKDQDADYEVPEKTLVTEALKGQIDDVLIAKGEVLYKKKGCAGCHKIEGQTQMIGPNLAGISGRMDDATMEAWIRHPKRLKAATTMPPFDGSDDQLIALIAWLKSL